MQRLRASLSAAEESLLRAEGRGDRTDAEALFLAPLLLSVRPNIRRALDEINNAILRVDEAISDTESE
ncbi:MAG TPA: hypothetical protein VGJ20_02565 [Xanthobacteraceae bacterium]|jgi:hypothetical protein